MIGYVTPDAAQAMYQVFDLADIVTLTSVLDNGDLTDVLDPVDVTRWARLAVGLGSTDFETLEWMRMEVACPLFLLFTGEEGKDVRYVGDHVAFRRGDRWYEVDEARMRHLTWMWELVCVPGVRERLVASLPAKLRSDTISKVELDRAFQKVVTDLE